MMSGKDAVLFFDTETTGIVRKDLSPCDPAQPHCVQIAALLCDREGEIKSHLNLLIRADGWRIPFQATQIHGITEEKTQKYGVREEVAAEIFYNLASNAFAVVGHNIEFDLAVIETLFHRVKKKAWSMPEHKYCTMHLSKKLLNLPPTQRMLNAGMSEPKAPSLAEAYRFFFKEEIVSAHDAMADTQACRRIFYELRRRRQEEKGNQHDG